MSKPKRRFLQAIIVIALFILIAGYKSFVGIPYSHYRAQISFRINDEPLRYFVDIDNDITAALKQSLSQREKAILKGMQFVIRVADKENNFQNFFSSFLLMLHEMTRSENRIHQRKIAERAIEKSLARAVQMLPETFPDNEINRWQLISTLQIVEKYPQFKSEFHAFYKKRFAHYPKIFTAEKGMSFQDAMKNKQYRIIGDYLIYTSFLYYYLASSPQTYEYLPEDRFKIYLKQFENFAYDLDIKVAVDFIELAFLATHVVLVLTNYGEFALTNNVNVEKAKHFIEATLNKVRDDLQYLDLFAEYVQCLKIFNDGDQKRIIAYEKLLFDLQRDDGSWGTERDFRSTPYDVIHPTWAVLTTLNHPSLQRSSNE